MKIRNLLYILAFTNIMIACNESKEKQENIITVTIQPQQYFAEQIAGDRFEIRAMVPAGSSPESFDPPASSFIALSKSRAYFRIGEIGFEKAWMDRLQAQAPKMKVYNNSQGINLIESAGHSHAHSHTHADSHSHCHHNLDPHIWTTPSLADSISANMCEALCQLAPMHRIQFEDNYSELSKELKLLDNYLHSMLDPIKGQSFVIYHPALTYFAKEYGLTQYAIENDGKEPSVSHLKNLIDEVGQTNAKVIFIQEEFDQKHAQTVANALGLDVVQINPLSKDWQGEMIKIAKALSDEQ